MTSNRELSTVGMTGPESGRGKLTGSREATRDRLLLAAGALWVVTSAALAATSANYAISPQATDASGGEAGSANYEAVLAVSGETFSAGTTSGGGNYAARAGQVALLPIASVAGRHVFYNQSYYDGNNSAANASDDSAIAPDKTALLPGGVATFANYTSYSRGINGIMIDVSELRAAPTTDDFEFRAGNDNSPDAWGGAPLPATVTTRWGAGVGGSDRVTLIWPNNQVQKQWLYVKVLPTVNINAQESDKFFFGNAIGETGNSAAEAFVNATDEIGVRNNLHSVFNPAPITSPYDFDRDRFVNAVEVSVVRGNLTTVFNDLNLIDLTGFGDEPLLPTNLMATSDGSTRAASNDLVAGHLPGSASGPFANELPGPTTALGSLAGSRGRLLPRFSAATIEGKGTVTFWFAPEPALQGIRIQACDDLATGWYDLKPQPALWSREDLTGFSVDLRDHPGVCFFRLVAEDVE